MVSAETADGLLLDYVPAAPETIAVAEDFTHLRFARGYVLHPAEREPAVPDFWHLREFAGRIFRWDPRSGFARAVRGQVEVLICGHALDPTLETTDLTQIADRLLRARLRSRQRYLNVLEEMFGQYVVLDRYASTTRAQSDAIASRSIFHSPRASIIASHVRLVGRTLARPRSRYAKWVGATNHNDFPGRTTYYDGVWLLTPNTEITLGTGRIRRIGPRAFRPLTVEEAAARVVPLIQKQVQVLMGSGRKILVSASAGVDSRSSLAAFADVTSSENIQAFTYTKAPGSGRQAAELHRDKLGGAMAEALGMPHQMFDLNSAAHPPPEYRKVLQALSTRRSNPVISWAYHTQLPHNGLHIRGQINGVGKWHFAQRLHFSESMELTPRRMASLTKRGKDVKRPLDDPWWKPGERGFDEYIRTTGLRSVPAGYRMTDLFLWEHRVANWNHPHIVESDVTFDTYQLFGSRQMIRLLLSVPELDRAQLSLFREVVSQLAPQLLEYPVNGAAWEPPRYDRPLSWYQQGTTDTDHQLAERTSEVADLKKQLNAAQEELPRDQSEDPE